ncbi:MAG: 3-deoxy-7-phosphoheptulonate synthase [Firmicutes bacterium]|jgi:3-deoxy-7-phosphoheptulonate synthase|nr:3-deoxy-7-phosphoheptulonate synthase [Bacillota bacterium]
MIVVMQRTATKEQINTVLSKLEELGFRPHPIHGVVKTVIGAIGERTQHTMESLELLAGVERVVPIMQPYKLASKELVEAPTTVEVAGRTIGGKKLAIIAGPCAVESCSQLLETAHAVAEAGATFLRGGAYKPRTSPYSFQGMEEEGLKILARAREEVGLPVVTEVINPADVPLVAKYVDILQIGARNMQNFTLLREVGRSGKPVILKRGLAATVEEWLMAAEYILSEGNYNVILCERGIRTYETQTRNTLDVSAIPLIKQQSHLPILSDPSHASGRWRLVEPLARASVAAGADGLMLEVHPNPSEALSDGPQSLRPEKFASLVENLKELASACGREV